MTSPPAIAVEDLSFRYLGRKLPALRNVSFAVAPGETLLVLGPSGGGKSTLALSLNGLIPHGIAGKLTGRVLVGGRDTREAPSAELGRTVGLVFQDPDAQFCMLRVDDELAFGLENVLIPPAEMPGRIRRALDRVGLAGRERSVIDHLSGGTRQRVALASVLVMEPSVLVFDEPTSNLDPAGAEEVFAVIAELKRQGDRTLVIVEHRLDHLIRLVDQVLVLGPAGTVVAQGPPVTVLRHRAAELRSFGVWTPQVSDVANRLAERGLVADPFPLTVDDAVEAFGRLLAGGASPPAPLHLRMERGEDDEGTPSPQPSPTGRGSSPSASSAAETARNTSSRNATEGRSVLPPLPLGEGWGEGISSPLRALQDADPECREPAIAISRLSFTYPGGAIGLRDVNLAVERGAFAAIVGPNGAGKSTLAKHLIGTIRPPAGAVHILGHDVRVTPAPELARLVGYVFQNPEHQFVARTVFDELALGLRLRHEPEDQVRHRVEETLASFGLSALASANPFTLSHGEKRRLSVATMLILGQEVLVLDEPTFGQDRKYTDALMAKLVALNRAGRTIVLITHDLRLVADYADTALVLIEGAVAYRGPARAEFADQALLTRARLGLPPLHEVARQLARIDPTFPTQVTVEGMVSALAERAPRVGFGPRRGDHEGIAPTTRTIAIHIEPPPDLGDNGRMASTARNVPPGAALPSSNLTGGITTALSRLTQDSLEAISSWLPPSGSLPPRRSSE